MGSVQVDNEMLWEKGWVAGVIERCVNKERILMGGGRYDGGINKKYPYTVDIGGKEGDRWLVMIISRV